MDNINEKIFNLYNSGGYWTKYASDVWITVILISIVFYTIMYFNILNNLQPIKANWVNERCSPAVMPSRAGCGRSPAAGGTSRGC